MNHKIQTLEDFEGLRWNKLEIKEKLDFKKLIDTVAQNFDYQPEIITLDKFDIFTLINTIPLDILFSQKIYASLNRKRSKGRDFFDLLFLMSKKVKPNYAYLEQKIGVSNIGRLKEKLIEEYQKLDFESLYKDVKPFLFNPNDQKILKFMSFIKGYQF